jgi:hypothetical protein
MLSYDDLPPGSDIRREFIEWGVRISVPAGEPSRAALREAAYSALISGAGIGAGIVVFAAGMFIYGVRVNRVSGVPLLWARAFFAVFCAAVVLLVAWVRYGMIADALRAGRRQSTALAAENGRLIIETAGPFGVASYDIAGERIRSIAAGAARLQDDRGNVRRVRCLTILLSDGWSIALLPGRSVRELMWVEGAVMRGLARSSETKTQPAAQAR